ncbi:uncharacterized protein LOC120708508 [Panicum virgatum]|uniref:Uncharacterized protein n=1 Tax=Panicum virgatum TaxID=38727 RepID=A0A8T0SZW1_PANVG|nr:uncharacterized protein LOC120708508 [Panicum virgatum]KAG2601619.1 hypothetical protein PVAP13_5KG608900 [Panicum virgatum]
MPPAPGVADQAQAAPRSPHRGNGGAVVMPQSPLRIRQDGKFYERLLTKDKETSAANLSFRYYWAEPGAVPFVWESQPGTPKDVARRIGAAGALPAITPPPSYLPRHGNGGGGGGRQAARHDQRSGRQRRRCRLRRIRVGFIAGIFRRLRLFRPWRRSAPPVKVSSSSSRWLFSSVAADTGEHTLPHQDDIAAVAKQQHKAAPGSFAAPWLLRLRGSSGSRGAGGGGTHGWA